MTISVIIAAYCGERFIGEQIASLLEQTLPPDEIIITDDSPDELTSQAVAQFTDARITYFHNEKSLGVNGNFEKALSLTHGEIIFFCDQDDVWKKDKIQTMVEALKNAPHAAGVFCNSSVVSGSLEPLGYSLWQMRGFTRGMQEKFNSGRQLEVFLKRVCCSTHNIAIRKRVRDKVLPFPCLDPFYADTLLGLTLAAENKWVTVDQELTCYRVHDANLSAPKIANISEQVALSRKARKKNSLVRTFELAEILLERLPENIPEHLRRRIAAFGRHYQIRAGYSGNFLFRGLQIFREILTLRYCRYSNGWKSIAADLFLFQ